MVFLGRKESWMLDSTQLGLIETLKKNLLNAFSFLMAGWRLWSIILVILLSLAALVAKSRISGAKYDTKLWSSLIRESLAFSLHLLLLPQPDMIYQREQQWIKANIVLSSKVQGKYFEQFRLRPLTLVLCNEVYFFKGFIHGRNRE